MFCESNGVLCLYRVTYATNGELLAHWDLMAKSTSEALTAAAELLPIGSRLINANLKEEW